MPKRGSSKERILITKKTLGRLKGVTLNKTIPDFVMRLWRRIRRFELTRTLLATEKRMDYVKKSLAYIDRAEGRTPR